MIMMIIIIVIITIINFDNITLPLLNLTAKWRSALTYIEATKEKWEKSYINLTRNERTSTKELSDREDIIIIKSVKGSAVVIIDVKDYIKDLKRRLNNTDNYRKPQ